MQTTKVNQRQLTVNRGGDILWVWNIIYTIRLHQPIKKICLETRYFYTYYTF